MSEKTAYTIQFQGDDMSPSPSRWTNRGINASMQSFFWWGYMQIPGRNPILLMRPFADGKHGVTGPLMHTECARGLFQTPTILDSNPVSGDDKAVGWHLSNRDSSKYGNDDDLVYESSVSSGDSTKVLYVAGTQRSYIKEGDFLEVTGENAEYAMCIDPPGVFGPYFTWSAVYKGRYYGQDVTFLGGADRFFFSDQTSMDLGDRNAFYWGAIISGMSADQRKEYGCFYMFNGKTFAYYVKDGETPRVSESVEYKAEWAADPSNPNCVVPTAMIWKFEDVEIHWKAEYTATYGNNPFINHFGHWYEQNGCKKFTQYLGVVESNIRPEHLKHLKQLDQ